MNEDKDLMVKIKLPGVSGENGQNTGDTNSNTAEVCNIIGIF